MTSCSRSTVRELERQNTTLQLIASGTSTSPPSPRDGLRPHQQVQRGYPGKRYYGGNAIIDDPRSGPPGVKELFGAEHANVQPHSGATPTWPSTMASCSPGDTVMGCRSNHGGHLTHGSPANASGKLYNFVSYQAVATSTSASTWMPCATRRSRTARRLIVTGATATRAASIPSRCGHLRRGGCLVHVRRRSHRRPDLRWHAPQPGSVRRHRHPHTHKTLRGPRGESSCRRPSTRPPSTRRSSPVCRAARSNT